MSAKEGPVNLQAHRVLSVVTRILSLAVAVGVLFAIWPVWDCTQIWSTEAPFTDQQVDPWISGEFCETRLRFMTWFPAQSN